MNSHWGGFGIAGLVGILVNLMFLALIVLAVVLVARALSRPSHPVTSLSAQQILAERFARGEIDAEEYQARLRILNGEPPPPAGP
ncbi:MAG TPA: SHOCT domain-containing protein [Jiangellales bacterium]|nr:SHOCT domain-containing protein [Jiangellales bacterium]